MVLEICVPLPGIWFWANHLVSLSFEFLAQFLKRKEKTLDKHEIRAKKEVGRKVRKLNRGINEVLTKELKYWRGG
jgi:hypothetical protein